MFVPMLVFIASKKTNTNSYQQSRPNKYRRPIDRPRQFQRPQDFSMPHQTQQPESEEEKYKNINGNIEVPYNFLGLGLINSSNSVNDKHAIYLVIKVHKYETSQEEIEMGLINPIEEFEKICHDFEINCQNECSFIDYNKAKEIKLSLFMLWGSMESLFQFFKDNNIKEAFDYFSKNYENKKRAGIYLCINRNKKIGYLIIWPGNLDYQYSKIDEPNDNILLTLIRYGFSLSSNSIICLTKNEIDTFNFSGAEIFEDIYTSGYGTERGGTPAAGFRMAAVQSEHRRLLVGCG